MYEQNWTRVWNFDINNILSNIGTWNTKNAKYVVLRSMFFFFFQKKFTIVLLHHYSDKYELFSWTAIDLNEKL